MKDLVGNCCFIQVCFSKIRIMWVKQCHEPSPVITIFIGGGVRRNAHHLPHNLHGVGWGGDVNVPSTAFLRPWTRCLQMLMLRYAFLRPCTRCGCYRCCCYAHMCRGGVGMLAFLHAPSTLHKMFMLHYVFPRPCAGCWCYRCWCYAHMGWGVVTWERA